MPDTDEWVWCETSKGEVLVLASTLEPKTGKRMKGKPVGGQEPIIKGRRYHLNKPYLARQVPLNHPDAPHKTKMGQCVFTSASEEREFARKTGATTSGASIESGNTKAADTPKVMPYQKTWDKIKYQAVKTGQLPKKGEPRIEMQRRQDEYLRTQDRAAKVRVQNKREKYG